MVSEVRPSPRTAPRQENGRRTVIPALPGLGTLTIFLENDEKNRKAMRECGLRWCKAGRDVFTLRPEIGSDLNDELCEAR